MATPGPALMVSQDHADHMDVLAGHVVMVRRCIIRSPITSPTNAITGPTRVQAGELFLEALSSSQLLDPSASQPFRTRLGFEA